jgi:hypothetical protein
MMPVGESDRKTTEVNCFEKIHPNASDGAAGTGFSVQYHPILAAAAGKSLRQHDL